jgi:hypothetical protein
VDVKPAATFCIFAAPGHKIFGDARFFSRCFSIQYFLNNRLLDSNFPSFILPAVARGRKEVGVRDLRDEKAGRAFPLVAAAALSCLRLQFLSSLPADSL